MSEEIKPCPFCGGEAELYRGGIKYVLCKECLATSCDFKTEAEAIEAWNARHERTCRSEDGYCSQCGTQLVGLFKCYTDEEGFTWGCKPYCPGCGARVANDD